ncbi:hypothetical protein B5G43_02875 [Flavonifractor sp. An92]|nr:hypothetical protein B5G43_02875 [Flavonifractor sp. An92]
MLITPESGSPFYATLAMADGATQPGTPWNRNTGNLLQADIRNYPIASGQTVTAGQVVDVTSDVPPTVGQYVPGSIQVQNVPVGSFITRTENGVPQYYLVVHQGLPSEMYDASCNGTWVLRLNIYENGAWDAGNSNVLPGADIFTTMAGMLTLFDAETQAAIKTIKIPYCVGGGQSTVKSGADGLECKIFPLSAYEVGLAPPAVTEYVPEDGATLDFFKPVLAKDPRRISPNANWWLRSPYIRTGLTWVWYEPPTGGGSGASPNSSYGIRPTFVLDPTLEVDGYYTGYTEAITTSGTPSQAIALQGGSAGDTIPVIFSGVARLSGVTQGQEITSPGVQGFGAMDGWLSVFPYWTPGAKIATGSYVGAGTYGSNNPNTLVFPFEPKMLMVLPNPASVTPSYSGFWCFGNPGITGQISSNYSSGSILSVSGTTVSWYNTSSSEVQLNNNNKTYYYVAIGY